METKGNFENRRIYFPSTIFVYFALFCASLPQYSHAIVVPEEEYRLSSQCILDGRYGDAEKILDDLINRYPHEPSGYLFKAALLEYRSTDYDDYSRDGEYLTLLEKAETLSTNVVKTCPKELWAYYFLYTAQSMRGVKSASSGHLTSGIITGRSGAKGMEWILSVDRNFYDAFFVTGCYRFWKSETVKPVSWLPFIDDDRKEGIEDVRKAIERGRLTGPLSSVMLMQMLMVFDISSAIEIGEKMTSLYPSCRLFSWGLGEAYKKKGNYKDAVRIFTGLAENFSKDSQDDGSGQLRCWWKLAVLSKSLGKMDECGEYCRRIVSLSGKDSIAKRQNSRIERAKKMLREIESESKY